MKNTYASIDSKMTEQSFYMLGTGAHLRKTEEAVPQNKKKEVVDSDPEEGGCCSCFLKGKPQGPGASGKSQVNETALSEQLLPRKN